MINLFKNTFRYILLRMLKYIPLTQEMWNEAVCREPRFLAFVSDHLKTGGMCIKGVEVDPYTLKYVPVHHRTQEMCKRAIEKYLYHRKLVSNHF